MVHVDVFLFNDTATTEIYTLSLHDALPIFCLREWASRPLHRVLRAQGQPLVAAIACEGQIHPVAYAIGALDRKSTRLNSSHANISYAVFCLKKKKHYPSLMPLPLPPALPIS